MEIASTQTLLNSGEQNSVAYIFSDGFLPAVTSGPLADAMTDALNKLYQKEIDPITGVVLECAPSAAMESQQIDEHKELAWYLARRKTLADAGVENPSMAMVYGVKADQTAPSDLVNVANIAANMTPQEVAQSVVIIDGDNKNTSNHTAIAAMEAYCQEIGISVFRSFNAFIRA